jgi:L-ribulose-5-phosphate 4-epimerase
MGRTAEQADGRSQRAGAHSGKTVEGRLRPSSDTKTHLVLYRSFRGLGGIVHTHSAYATGWAQARLAIPIYGTTHADHLAEDVPCTDVMSEEAVERDCETETGNQILECFRNRNSTPPRNGRWSSSGTSRRA